MVDKYSGDHDQIMKREVLAKIACLFDSLGLDVLSIIHAKLIFQRL